MQCQTGFHSHFFCPGNRTGNGQSGTQVPVDTPRKEQLEATDMLCVQRSTSSPKEQIRRPKTKTCQSVLKLFTGANPVKCFCTSLLAMKTVLNYITRKYSFGARSVNA